MLFIRCKIRHYRTNVKPILIKMEAGSQGDCPHNPLALMRCDSVRYRLCRTGIIDIFHQWIRSQQILLVKISLTSPP